LTFNPQLRLAVGCVKAVAVRRTARRPVFVKVVVLVAVAVGQGDKHHRTKEMRDRERMMGKFNGAGRKIECSEVSRRR
jgi:hypothetical protein